MTRKANAPAKIASDDPLDRISTFRAPTRREAESIKAAVEREKQRPTPPAVQMEDAAGDKQQVWPVHSDGVGFGAHIRDTFGTAANSYCDAAMTRLEYVLRERGQQRGAQATTTNAALALLSAVGAQNELEAAIGEQIVATHSLSMDLMGRARHADRLDAAQAYTTMATKVSRTMASHIETLGKLRSGGKQQVEVRYVYVQGNAIVGDGAQAVFTNGGMPGGGTRNPHQPHAPAMLASSPAAPVPAMWRSDAAQDRLHVTSGEGSETLPDARPEEPGGA